MIKKHFMIVLLLCVTSVLFAQTAGELDTLLETKAVSASVSARFVLGAADLLPANVSGNDAESAAFDMAKEKGWIKKEAGEGITLRETAFLIMNAFNMKGGVMYKFIPNPRYAYREMVYRKLIQGKADPSMSVSGERLLQIIGRTQDYVGTLATGEQQ